MIVIGRWLLAVIRGAGKGVWISHAQLIDEAAGWFQTEGKVSDCLHLGLAHLCNLPNHLKFTGHQVF